MSTEYISGLGGLYQVLTSDEMLENDIAGAREKILRGGLPRFLADRLVWGS